MPRYDADRNEFVARIDRRRRWLGRGAKLLNSLGLLKKPVQMAVHDAAFSSDVELMSYAYARKNDHLPDLENPTWYNEKVRWQFLNHHNPLMSLVADKIAVRDYIALRGGVIQAPRLIASGWAPEALDKIDLPAEFALKTSFGSGQNHLERADKRTRRSALVTKVRRWMGYDQWRSTGEFHYRSVPKRWLVEEFVPCQSGQIEYKIFCMMGEPVFILVVKERTSKGYKRSLYWPDWTPTDFHWLNFPVDPVGVPRPDTLDVMLADARRYAADFLHVRVDFFQSDDRIDFSELTFASAAARVPFTPIEANVRLGDMIDLTRAEEYRERGARIADELGWPPAPKA
jgi:hypothetical protein